MKVKYMQTQVVNNEVVYRLEGDVPEEFDNIDEAAKWINSWLEMKTDFVANMGFEHERHGNVLRWMAFGITFIEVLDVTV